MYVTIWRYTNKIEVVLSFGPNFINTVWITSVQWKIFGTSLLTHHHTGKLNSLCRLQENTSHMSCSFQLIAGLD